MPKVELTARLARETNATQQETILYDRSLPGCHCRSNTLRTNRSGAVRGVMKDPIGGWKTARTRPL